MASMTFLFFSETKGNCSVFSSVITFYLNGDGGLRWRFSFCPDRMMLSNDQLKACNFECVLYQFPPLFSAEP